MKPDDLSRQARDDVCKENSSKTGVALRFTTNTHTVKCVDALKDPERLQPNPLDGDLAAKLDAVQPKQGAAPVSDFIAAAKARKRAVFLRCHFIPKNDHFAKTDSVETQGKLKKRHACVFSYTSRIWSSRPTDHTRTRCSCPASSWQTVRATLSVGRFISGAFFAPLHLQVLGLFALSVCLSVCRHC